MSSRSIYWMSTSTRRRAMQFVQVQTYRKSAVAFSHSCLLIFAISPAPICHAKIRGKAPSKDTCASEHSRSKPSGPMTDGSSGSAYELKSDVEAVGVYGAGSDGFAALGGFAAGVVVASCVL